MFGNYQSYSEAQVLDGVKKHGPAQGAGKVINWEMEHALAALETGTYITWWNEDKRMECGRLGKNSLCFCGHSLPNHEDKYFTKKVNTTCKKCPCKTFRVVPRRPEECGMYWLTRRKDFNVTKWRAPCKCKHTHEEHNPNFPSKCQNCSCRGFDSYFACISCDQRWEHHIVLYETEMERRQDKKPVGQEFLPLSTHKEIQGLVFDEKNKLRPKPKEEDQMLTWDRNQPNPYNQIRPEGMQTISDIFGTNKQIQNGEEEEYKNGNDRVFKPPARNGSQNPYQRPSYTNNNNLNAYPQSQVRSNSKQNNFNDTKSNINNNNNVQKKPFLKRSQPAIQYPVSQKNKPRQSFQ